MAEIVLFHSALGLRRAVLADADRLRGAGHVVERSDQVPRRTAKRRLTLEHQPTSAFARELPELLRVATLPDRGVHGGHLATVSSEQDAGHALTLNVPEGSAVSAKRQEAVVLAAATSTSESP